MSMGNPYAFQLDENIWIWIENIWNFEAQDVINYYHTNVKMWLLYFVKNNFLCTLLDYMV